MVESLIGFAGRVRRCRIASMTSSLSDHRASWVTSRIAIIHDLTPINSRTGRAVEAVCASRRLSHPLYRRKYERATNSKVDLVPNMRARPITARPQGKRFCLAAVAEGRGAIGNMADHHGGARSISTGAKTRPRPASERGAQGVQCLAPAIRAAKTHH